MHPDHRAPITAFIKVSGQPAQPLTQARTAPLLGQQDKEDHGRGEQQEEIVQRKHETPFTLRLAAHPPTA